MSGTRGESVGRGEAAGGGAGGTGGAGGAGRRLQSGDASATLSGQQGERDAAGSVLVPHQLLCSARSNERGLTTGDIQSAE